MAALATTVARIWSAGALEPESTHPAARLARMEGEARRMSAYWLEVDPDLVRHATPLLAGILYTHSRSGTLEAVFQTLAAVDDAPRRVLVAESRPGGEGVGLAHQLAGRGWEVTLVSDAACGVFMSQVDAVVVGADSVRPEGSVVNKIGTYPLALMARAHQKPFYTVCESLKIAPRELPLVLERLPGLTADESENAVPLDTIAFDVTPAELVTRIVTERGALTVDEIARLAASASADYQRLFSDVTTAVWEG